MDTKLLSDGQLTYQEIQAKDPFHSLPNELLVQILDRISARQRCRLRLQNHNTREMVDKYELARSISLYIHDGSRTGEPWNTLPNYSRIDLRKRLTALACEYDEHSTTDFDRRKVLDAVSGRLESLLLGPFLKRREPAPEFVMDTIIELHHLQRLLVDQERRGLALDDELVVAQRSLESRLVDFCGLRRQLDWPVDMAGRA